ncbi:hypothetical protein [Pedobacter agri]|uniref:hypothetical protein n=1 Tax=Pedobacter agri TaxID=454586 RepID=UPI002930D5C3|nr:hypothetical protein [Pedobacter agri]
MENFNGTIAMVSDRSDGESKQMQIGIISAVDQMLGRVDITFATLEKEQFAFDQVHVLKDRHALYQLLMSASGSIPLGDFKTLFKVNMLQDRGDPSALLDAFQLLKHSPSAAALATDTLGERMHLAENLQQANHHPGR